MGGTIRPLFWFAITIQGVKVPIYLSTPKLTKHLRVRRWERGKTLGVTVPDKVYEVYGHTVNTKYHGQEIYINAAPERDVQDQTLLHEIMHVLLGDVPPSVLLGDAEEHVAETFGLRALATLAPLGIKVPRRPKGARRLEDFARAA